MSLIMLIFSLFFIIFSIIMIFFSLSFNGDTLMLEVSLFSFDALGLSFMVVLDKMSSSFSGVVFLISGIVIMYSCFYMGLDFSSGRFFVLLVCFVFSMLILIFSPNLISLMIGWDGLGVISFLLIIFYGNFSSLRSGLVSIYVNRLGDVGLMLTAYMMVESLGWINEMILDMSGVAFLLFFLGTSMTKSAMIPFSSWLPAAMAAPTPISSLVHSSTLVTAGVYLMIRFNNIFLSFLSSSLFSFLSLSTMLMAGFIALMESDLKKIVAMSTLSQLGLMMYMLSVGEIFFCFFHLLTHALFKSLLFLSCGGLILSSGGGQDLRDKGMGFLVSPFFSFLFSFSSLALGGLPFLAGFYSKDLCLESLMEGNLGIFSNLFFVMGCFLTVCYSLRSFMGGISSSLVSLSTVGIGYSFLVFPLFILLIMTVIGGKLFSLLFLIDELVFSFSLLKLIGMVIILGGIIIYMIKLSLGIGDFFLSIFSLDFLWGKSISSNLSLFSFFFEVMLLEKVTLFLESNFNESGKALLMDNLNSYKIFINLISVIFIGFTGFSVIVYN